MIVPRSREGQTQKNMQYFYSQLSVLLAFICKAGAASKLLKIARAQSPHNFKNVWMKEERMWEEERAERGTGLKGKRRAVGWGARWGGTDGRRGDKRDRCRTDGGLGGRVEEAHRATDRTGVRELQQSREMRADEDHRSWGREIMREWTKGEWYYSTEHSMALNVQIP